MIWKTCLCIALAASTMLINSACSPEVGSEAWCKQLEERPKNDWTAQNVTDYTKYCILRLDPHKQ